MFLRLESKNNVGLLGVMRHAGTDFPLSGPVICIHKRDNAAPGQRRCAQIAKLHVTMFNCFI